jgi:glycosyltransferase involved in cell wall biosynthesis
MKILQIGPNSVHVSSYISALSETDKDIYLLSEEACDFQGVKENFVISFRSLNPIAVLKSKRLLKQLLVKLKPEVIHIHQVNRAAYFVARIAQKLNIRVVTTAWGSDVLLIPKQNAFFKYLVTQTLKNSAIVTADSQDMIQAMKALYPQGNYKLLQYGIDPIQALEKEKIIYSNRLHEPLYRIEKVIEYFSQFSAQHPDWKLVVAGTGSQTEHLKSLVNESNLSSKTSFVGWQKKPENSAWYAKSSIYISIPTSDGTSVSVLEAMSAGCIPVVADLPVSHEWIVSEKNGIIEKSGENPLLKALEIDIETCAKLNSDLIHEKATRAASIKEFVSFYKSLKIR